MMVFCEGMRERLASLINGEHTLCTENNICQVVILGMKQTQERDEMCRENRQEQQQMMRIGGGSSLERIICCSLRFLL